MTYIYNANVQSKELTVRHQKNKDIPLPLLIILFSRLTKVIETIFISYGNKDEQIRKMLSNILNKKIVLKESDPGYLEVELLKKLLNGEIEAFKETMGDHVIDENTIDGYAKVFKVILFTHIFGIISNIINQNRPKNFSQMWSGIPASEETDIEEKEQVKDIENINKKY